LSGIVVSAIRRQYNPGRLVNVVCSAAIGALALSAVEGANSIRFADAPARMVFERSRAALWVNDIHDLRSLVFKGRVRVPSNDGGTTVDSTVEIRILLPDRFLRIDRIDESAASSPGRISERRSRDRAQFTRLMLGAAAYNAADSALTVQSTGESAFPDTVALDVSGKSFSARYVVDAGTSVPLRLVYFGERSVSTVVSFADRRVTNGIDLPFRVTTRTGERVLETLTFDEILVNPPLTKSDFESR
jgi:hypothetical protein